jgi:hypothetical protein
MFWWIIALVMLLALLSGIDLVGLLIAFFLFIIGILATLAGVDRRRRRHHQNWHTG